MTQAERRLFLIRSLMKEKTEYRDLSIPAESGEQKRLPRLHRQLHPHLCGRPAAAGMCPPDGGAGARRAHGTGEAHPGV